MSDHPEQINPTPETGPTMAPTPRSPRRAAAAKAKAKGNKSAPPKAKAKAPAKAAAKPVREIVPNMPSAATLKSANIKLNGFAKEIIARLNAADRDEAKADQHRLSAALQFAEAKALCDANKINFKEWHANHLGNLTLDYVNRLVKIGSSDDPKLALEDMRADTARRNRKMRERKKAAEAEQVISRRVSRDTDDVPRQITSRDPIGDEMLNAARNVTVSWPQKVERVVDTMTDAPPDIIQRLVMQLTMGLNGEELEKLVLDLITEGELSLSTPAAVLTAFEGLTLDQKKDLLPELVAE